MRKLFRLASTAEIGDNIVATLVDQNGETSLHLFTPDALERFRAREPLPMWRNQAHEQVGALPPLWAQRVEIFTSRREVL
jgi:hypothetical protein